MLALAVGGKREHSQDVLLRPAGKVAQNLGMGHLQCQAGNGKGRIPPVLQSPDCL